MASYATHIQFQNAAFGLPAKALAAVSPTEQLAALEAASRDADSYLANRYTLPITQWGTDLTNAVCNIAAYNLLAGRGFAPNSGSSDEHVRLRYEDAIRWLRDCSSGKATPTNITDSTPAIDQGLVDTEAPMFNTNSRRGWGR